jgi:hypothetical protein
VVFGNLLDGFGKISPPVSELQTIHLVVILYRDYAILAFIINL